MEFNISTKGHFFASSVAEWKADTNLDKLLRFMKGGNMTFSLWFVPCDIDTEYEIDWYKPLFDGAIMIATYNTK